MSKFAGLLKAARNDEAELVVSQTRGRPKGKRSDPSFEQVTAYIRKDTYRQTKLALLQAAEEKDFSQLVEELLDAYLRTQKST